MGWSTRGSVNIPLVTDVVGLRVSAFKREDPAWLDNVVSTDAPIQLRAKTSIQRIPTADMPCC